MTIIASWGGEGTNAYVDITEANSFIMSGIVYSDPWASSTSLQREAALVEATRDIDALQYIGQRYVSYQTLQWPRSSLTGGWPYRLAVEPGSVETEEQIRQKEAVKHACCHQAVFLLGRKGRNKHAQNRADGIESYSEDNGPLSEFVKYRPGLSSPLCVEAERYLSAWISARRVYRA